jgi:hypothetical protein
METPPPRPQVLPAARETLVPARVADLTTKKSRGEPTDKPPVDDRAVVNVTIGRVVVRTSAPPAPVQPRRPPAPRPGPSLQEYLERRRGIAR